MSVFECRRAKEVMWDSPRGPGCILHASLVGHPIPVRLCLCRCLQRRVPSSMGGSEGEALVSERCSEHWMLAVTPRDTDWPCSYSCSCQSQLGPKPWLSGSSPSHRLPLTKETGRRAVVTGMALGLSPRGRTGAVFHIQPEQQRGSILSPSLWDFRMSSTRPVHSTP